jgi:predicted transcriptional regulator
MKIPLPHQTNVRLDDETFERLMELVQQYKLTKSDVIREALIRDLDRRDREKVHTCDSCD